MAVFHIFPWLHWVVGELLEIFFGLCWFQPHCTSDRSKGWIPQMFPSGVSNVFFHLFWSGHFFLGLVDVSSPLPLSLDHLHPWSPAATLPTSALPGSAAMTESLCLKVSVLRLPMASHGFPVSDSIRKNRPLPALPLCRTSTWTSKNRGSCRLWVDQNSRSVSIASLLLYKEPHYQTLFTILHTYTYIYI